MRCQPQHVLDLAILGAVASMPLTVGGVAAVVWRLGGPSFRPTTEVVTGRITALADAGLLERVGAPGVGEDTLEATAAGLTRARRLLRAELDPAGVLGAATTALKVCSLGLLEPGARAEVVGDLVARCGRELASARAALARCPCRSAFTRRWLARDVERLAAELHWLRDLAPSEAGPDLELAAR